MSRRQEKCRDLVNEVSSQNSVANQFPRDRLSEIRLSRNTRETLENNRRDVINDDTVTLSRLIVSRYGEKRQGRFNGVAMRTAHLLYFCLI